MIKLMNISRDRDGKPLTSLYDDFYTPLEDAVEELWRRWNDLSLKKRVEDYLGYMPLFLQDKPKAILGRFIATPNYEMFRFLKLVRRIDMAPVVMELSRDKFCTRNPDKLSLVHMPFYKSKDKNGRILFEYHNVSDCTKNQGKHLCDITTYSGESLVNLHRRLLSSCMNSIEPPIVVDDAFNLFSNGRPRLFYSYFLPRFICHGILFENFITNKEEQTFFTDVVMPAFTDASNRFGFKPLIVPLLPDDKASDIFWRCYPYELKIDVLKDIHNELVIA